MLELGVRVTVRVRVRFRSCLGQTNNDSKRNHRQIKNEIIKK